MPCRRRCTQPCCVGDVAYGSDSVLGEAEARDQPYLTKLSVTKIIKALSQTFFHSTMWEEAGQGLEGIEDTLRLSGWSSARRAVILRRPLTGEMLPTGKDDDPELLAFIESAVPTKRYEPCWSPRPRTKFSPSLSCIASGPMLKTTSTS